MEDSIGIHSTCMISSAVLIVLEWSLYELIKHFKGIGVLGSSWLEALFKLQTSDFQMDADVWKLLFLYHCSPRHGGSSVSSVVFASINVFLESSQIPLKLMLLTCSVKWSTLWSCPPASHIKFVKGVFVLVIFPTLALYLTVILCNDFYEMCKTSVLCLFLLKCELS